MFSILLIYTPKIVFTDNAHFYKAPQLHRSSTTCWFDRKKSYEVSDWYTKIDASYAYGSTSKCWDKNGHTAPLLNPTGNYNMLYLMENVALEPSQQNFAEFLGDAIINHSKTNDTFGQLEFDGKFRINNFNIDLRQNLVSNFYLEAHLPIRNLKLYNISYTDKSPATGIFSQQYWAWKIFKNNLNTILSNHNLKEYNTSYSETGLGDASILLGWQDIETNIDNEHIKLISFGLKSGILFPTGKAEKTDQVFSIPTGYKKHWGIPLECQLDIGPYDWLTLTLNGGAIIFFDKTLTKRMQTHSKQQGLMKLAIGETKERKGSLWHLEFDIKFDHFASGLSALVGYSYNRKDKDHLTPSDNSLFDMATVNYDLSLKAWDMNVLHFMIDYDFSLQLKNKKLAPKINVFYNYPFNGKNAFKTSMLGAGLGIDIRWKI